VAGPAHQGRGYGTEAGIGPPTPASARLGAVAPQPPAGWAVGGAGRPGHPLRGGRAPAPEQPRQVIESTNNPIPKRCRSGNQGRSFKVMTDKPGKPA